MSEERACACACACAIAVCRPQSWLHGHCEQGAAPDRRRPGRRPRQEPAQVSPAEPEHCTLHLLVQSAPAAFARRAQRLRQSASGGLELPSQWDPATQTTQRNAKTRMERVVRRDSAQASEHASSGGQPSSAGAAPAPAPGPPAGPGAGGSAGGSRVKSPSLSGSNLQVPGGTRTLESRLDAPSLQSETVRRPPCVRLSASLHVYVHVTFTFTHSPTHQSLMTRECFEQRPRGAQSQVGRRSRT